MKRRGVSARISGGFSSIISSVSGIIGSIVYRGTDCGGRNLEFSSV